MTEGRDLHRFSFTERAVHWVVGLCFVVLLATGLAFSYPSLYWLTALLGGGAAARVLHPWIGLVFTSGLVWMFVIWVRDMGIDDGDRAFLGALPDYALGRKDRVPPVGKYNGGQKLFFWVQSLLGVIFLLSGIPLWFPGVLGSGWQNALRLIHYLATLGGGVFLIAHVYLGTIAYPGTARGILHGKVSREWARHHHPLWYKEKTGG